MILYLDLKLYLLCRTDCRFYVDWPIFYTKGTAFCEKGFKEKFALDFGNLKYFWKISRKKIRVQHLMYKIEKSENFSHEGGLRPYVIPSL